jgi:arginase family enzyme
VSRSLILDFDQSVRPLPDCDVIDLHRHQETIRFGCSMRALRRLGREIEPAFQGRPPVIFMGSGDYHHVSYLLIERLRNLDTKIEVVVFDNHPDNMRYPFGIHCGSWVSHVSRLPFVTRIHVAGITSHDVEGIHLLENHLANLYSGRVVYWCVQRNLRPMRSIGIRKSRSFASMAELLTALNAELAQVREPLYLSIDKDVLSPDVAQTNWDQGVMQLQELTAAIEILRPRVIGSDIVGEVSSYRYRSRWKRVLSALDRQPAIPPEKLAEWQSRHQSVNRQLLTLLSP